MGDWGIQIMTDPMSLLTKIGDLFLRLHCDHIEHCQLSIQFFSFVSQLKAF